MIFAHSFCRAHRDQAKAIDLKLGLDHSLAALCRRQCIQSYHVLAFVLACYAE